MRQFPNSQIILRFENANIANGLFTWNDDSGLNRHFTQATATAQPTINSDGITFDGVNDQLTGINNAGLLNNVNAVTYAVVYKKPTTGNPGFSFYISCTNNANNNRSQISNANGDQFRHAGRRLDSDANVDITSPTSGRLVVNTWYIHVTTIDYASAFLSIRVNGQTRVATNFQTPGNSQSGNPLRTTIGRGNTNTQTSFFSGTISDIFVAHSNDIEDVYKLEGYLASIRNLQSSLVAGHPYKNQAP